MRANVVDGRTFYSFEKGRIKDNIDRGSEKMWHRGAGGGVLKGISSTSRQVLRSSTQIALTPRSAFARTLIVRDGHVTPSRGRAWSDFRGAGHGEVQMSPERIEVFAALPLTKSAR